MEVFTCIIIGIYAAMIIIGAFCLPEVKKTEKALSLVGFFIVFIFILSYVMDSTWWVVLLTGLFFFQIVAILNERKMEKKDFLLHQIVRFVFHISLILVFIF